jgi:hypothetical protein
MKASIDQIEEGIALLTVKGDNASIMFPVKYLPPNSKPGDIVDFTVIKDEEYTERERKAIADMMREVKARSGQK